MYLNPSICLVIPFHSCYMESHNLRCFTCPLCNNLLHCPLFNSCLYRNSTMSTSLSYGSVNLPGGAKLYSPKSYQQTSGLSGLVFKTCKQLDYTRYPYIFYNAHSLIFMSYGGQGISYLPDRVSYSLNLSHKMCMYACNTYAVSVHQVMYRIQVLKH